MSLEAMVWVLSGDAPVSDVNEYAVLGAMADKADSDGCGSWLSKETIAARVHVSDETVKRCWRTMTKRGLIARGDQSLVKHYRADRRPVVYDLLIPYDWFSNIDRVNAERERMGRNPLTRQDRPAIAPAPAKPVRADKGKPRARGNSETPRAEIPKSPDGGTTSRPRGNYKSSTGELTVPQYSHVTQSSTAPDLPSVRPSGPVGDVRAAETRDGGTDGRVGREQQEPGGRAAAVRLAAPTAEAFEVIDAIGRAQANLQLSGKPRTDQARKVDGLLAAGYLRVELVEVLGGPIEVVRTTAANVVSARISELPAFPPRSVRLPGQAQVPARSGPTCPDCGKPTARLGLLCADCNRLEPGEELPASVYRAPDLAKDGLPVCVDGCGQPALHSDGRCWDCHAEHTEQARAAAALAALLEPSTGSPR